MGLHWRKLAFHSLKGSPTSTNCSSVVRDYVLEINTQLTALMHSIYRVYNGSQQELSMNHSLNESSIDLNEFPPMITMELNEFQ